MAFRLRIGNIYFHSVTIIVHLMINKKEKILDRIIEIIFEHPFGCSIFFASHTIQIRVVLFVKFAIARMAPLTFI